MPNIQKVKPRTLSGFMELPPEKQIVFDLMTSRVRESFESFGFAPLDTPVIESAEVLLAKAGGETEKQIYRLTKGERDLALRFDLTVPLAKYAAANYGSLAFPFRRYQIGKVYRGERSQRGRYRELYQADIDVVGDGALGLFSDAEIPAVIYRTFRALGLGGFAIRISNRKILTGFFETLGLTERSGDIMRAVDKLDKIGAGKLRELLLSELSLPAPDAEAVLSLALASGEGDALDALESRAGRSETFDRGLRELREVTRLMEELGVPKTHYKVDPAVARGLDYYTGTVYETILTEHPDVGSVCSGGRYDDLAGHYTDKKLPGVGMSIGLTRLFFILDDTGLFDPRLMTAPCDAIIIPMTGDLSHAARLASSMRAAGLRVSVYSEDKKPGQKLAYADKLGVPFAVFLGEDEIKSGRITVKNMDTGEQTTASPGMLTEGIKEKTAERKRLAPVGG
ncbi:MAG: histidine--tRNA ligase [Oscillospiraceae bacterium]|jgi:histidyl-tRNA synthetase|nr:histidine--tRNA ligase [Oscillospiraceae bacterium]